MSERLTREICGFAHGLSGITIEGALAATGKSWCRGEFEATACVERLFELETALLDNSGEKVIDNDRLRAIAEAERDGRLVVLPCKIGSKVYAIRTYTCDDCEHYVQDADECDFKCPERIEEIPFELWMAEDKHRIPARIFFIKAEAEAALSAGKGE